ncbi:tetratricopeptide repeat protein [Phenylobacterium sp.]|uniref:glycosyltransferase family 9 protein n=1 Tax=Phenylobacterium sp. TaxID=1871053 RepID=UPI0025E560A0|nr:tetratricopeptide repeat protein [Phenylobacterium sp.]
MRDPARSDRLRTQAAQALAAGRLGEAQARLESAVRADPRSAFAHHDLGGLHKLQGRLPEAETSLRAAHALAPDDAKTRHALGIVLLSQGRYREGWPLYDARHAIPELRLLKPALPYPAWTGEDVAGKRLLIFPEQGLGDQIQYARFAPWLAARGADVTLMCHPALARLFDRSLGVRVIAASGQVDFPDPDYWVMSGSITGRTGLGPDALPNAPYLRSGDGGPAASGGLGVVTRGNPAHTNDANRSLPPDLAARLLALPAAVSLQPEDTGAKDFADTAALVAGLDLVIAVDTAVAHLAAAMGKPTWILLPRLMTDWRWMEDRPDSPWYPSARLFRQPRAGDWTPVLDEVRAALAARLP